MPNPPDPGERIAVALEALPEKFARALQEKDAQHQLVDDLRATVGAMSPAEVRELEAQQKRDDHDREQAKRSERRANAALVLSGLAATGTLIAAITQLA